jgi:glycine cleavage system H protein
MAEVPDELKYTETHEWVRVDDNEALIGITDYAQAELSDIVYIDLPSTGKVVKKGEALGSIEAVKAVSDFYAPISGEVVETNLKLADSPDLLNKAPYKEGWILRLRISDPSELTSLLSSDEYRRLIAQPG